MIKQNNASQPRMIPDSPSGWCAARKIAKSSYDEMVQICNVGEAVMQLLATMLPRINWNQ
ncbi:MAG: hypothetical protein IZT55_00680 [Anaerolineae bacterium]|nr:hypothetical protein [Anaerolineae bacterium]